MSDSPRERAEGQFVPTELTESMGEVIRLLEGKNQQLEGKLIGDFGGGESRAIVLPYPVSNHREGRPGQVTYLAVTPRGFRLIQVDSEKGRAFMGALKNQIQERQRYKRNPDNYEHMAHSGDRSGFQVDQHVGEQVVMMVDDPKKGIVATDHGWYDVYTAEMQEGVTLNESAVNPQVVAEIVKFNEDRVVEDIREEKRAQDEAERVRQQAVEKSRIHIDSASLLKDLLK
jgi:hypothetical protein